VPRNAEDKCCGGCEWSFVKECVDSCRFPIVLRSDS
jgi:hypothetical protein